VLLAVITASASYYLLERPVMRFKEPRRGRGRSPSPRPDQSTSAA
jgi:peptidoglycan/LPS O-acetylase OafA/YrhL